ncbi:MAG: hypothetical protein H0X14_02210 [Acidobacteria bacterium]|nr:hypothetical protein [Acidobacteriota bacterium]
MSIFPQNEGARVCDEVKQRRNACRKRLRHNRAVRKNGLCGVSGAAAIVTAPLMPEFNERREAEDFEGHSNSAEALDGEYASIKG